MLHPGQRCWGDHCHPPGGRQDEDAGHLWPGEIEGGIGTFSIKCRAQGFALGALANEAGITLIQMAVAFVTRHPAVTSAIIGPRTREHLDSYLEASGIDLSSDVLDRIAQIVPPESRSTSPTTCGTPAHRRSVRRSAAGRPVPASTTS